MFTAIMTPIRKSVLHRAYVPNIIIPPKTTVVIPFSDFEILPVRLTSPETLIRTESCVSKSVFMSETRVSTILSNALPDCMSAIVIETFITPIILTWSKNWI